jgi:hypothetical protein
MAVDQTFEHGVPGPNVIRTVIVLLLDLVCECDWKRLERLLDFPNLEAQDRAIRRARQRRCDRQTASWLGRCQRVLSGMSAGRWSQFQAG